MLYLSSCLLFPACVLSTQNIFDFPFFLLSSIIGILGLAFGSFDIEMFQSSAAVDESKLTDGLGPGFPVPVEITPFCHEHTMRQVASLPSCEGCKPVLRMGSSSNNQVDGDEIAVTDNGNYIVDLHFTEPIKDARKMAEDIKKVVGVVGPWFVL